MFSEDLLQYAKKEYQQPDTIDRQFSAANSSCGDKVTLKIGADSIGLEVEGCLICRAAAGKAVERIENKGLETLQEMDEDSFLSFLDWDLTPMREDCALTVYRAVTGTE